jgi:uncharacterized protein DUF3604
MRSKTMRSKVSVFTLSVLCSALLSSNSFAEKTAGGHDSNVVSKPNPLNNLYFGEQHLHTSASVDAFIMGNRKNDINDAFNYNKGKPVKKWITGETLQRKRAYDWTAVTDHSEYMSIMEAVSDPKSPLQKDPIVEALKTNDPAKMDAAFKTLAGAFIGGVQYAPFNNMKILKPAWDRHKEAINQHNEPGKFTTLIAYEWTSMPGGENLHRNVFFRDDEGPDYPFTSMDSNRPEDLWTWQESQRVLGHENFSIAHNGNISNSRMYAPYDSEGQPLSKRYAERRALNEPATEIMQVKSASETHPALSPNDEFADYELFYNGLIGSNPKVVSRIDYGFIRQALVNGLEHEQKLGVNPFKFGIVAGADSHSALTINEEFNFTGPHGISDATPKARLSGAAISTGSPAVTLSSAGSTAVWAPENTREAIFDAIKRKETYATSGTYIRLRFFGGWNYGKGMVKDADFVKKAYANGVPMGQDLPAKPTNTKAPTFAVWAVKDPDSGNLDRVQIIKGWQAAGHGHEQVYDVVWSDDRKPDVKTGKLPPVGNTVDIKNATYENSIGDTQLSTVWTDPDFDPSQHAVYYVRVLEIPTPRWSTYDAKTLGIDPPAGYPATQQERAWSSPIWYTPDPRIAAKAKYDAVVHGVTQSESKKK